jgi:hypothetical protein
MPNQCRYSGLGAIDGRRTAQFWTERRVYVQSPGEHGTESARGF